MKKGAWSLEPAKRLPVRVGEVRHVVGRDVAQHARELWRRVVVHEVEVECVAVLPVRVHVRVEHCDDIDALVLKQARVGVRADEAELLGGEEDEAQRVAELGVGIRQDARDLEDGRGARGVVVRARGAAAEEEVDRVVVRADDDDLLGLEDAGDLGDDVVRIAVETMESRRQANRDEAVEDPILRVLTGVGVRGRGS